MPVEHPRARRYPFVTKIELTDVRLETHIEDRTSDLSLFGCYVETQKPFPQGTKLKIRIAHRGANFEALGRTAYVRPNSGMGIVFTKIDQNDQLILEKWIAELRAQRE
jgi:hypothetical protein